MSRPVAVEKRPPAGARPDFDASCIAERLATLEGTETLRRLRGHARMIAVKIEGIDKALQQLCQSTCSDCSDPCCARATICYDRRDLLFYTLHMGEPPLQQTLKESGGQCFFRVYPAGKDPDCEGCVYLAYTW